MAKKVNSAKAVYEELRKVDWKEYNAQNCATLAEILMKSGKTQPDSPKKEVAQVIHLAARVAHHTDLKGFENFFKNGEVPPFKLSKEEMHVLKGGGFWATLGWIGLGVVALVAVGGISGLGRGIGDVGSAIGHGAAAVGGAIWSGTKAVGGFIWDGGRGNDNQTDTSGGVKADTETPNGSPPGIRKA